MDYLEKQILGCFIKDNTLLKDSIISVYHFDEKNTHHRKIFKTMQQLSNQGKVIDQVTLMTECYDMLQDLGGPTYLTDLEGKGDPNHFEDYEQKLIELYKKRESERAVQQYLSSEEKDIQNLVSKLNEIDSHGTKAESKVYDIYAELLDEPYQPREKQLTGVPSGIKDLDVMTGGFQNKTSIIIGARPSMGKTDLMLHLTRAAFTNDVVPVVFSLEMSSESLQRRLIASTAGINRFYARNTHMLSDAQKRKWVDTIGYLSSFSVEIYDEPGQTIPEMRAKIRQTIEKYPGKQIVVFIDYLTLIQNKGKFHSDHARVSDISNRLKAMAKEYDCPVVTLAQLSRSVEQRSDKHPAMSDLRESGSIEQDADIIMLLYRDEYYNSESDKENILEIDVAKHRDGPTGQIEVYYNKATGEIKNLERGYENKRTV